MVRVIALLWLVGAGAVSPALARQATPGSPANQQAAPAPQSDLIELLETFPGKIEIEGDLWRLRERVNFPIPRHMGFRIFADLIEINLKTEHMVATSNVTFEGPDSRISAERIEFSIKAGTATFITRAGL